MADSGSGCGRGVKDVQGVQGMQGVQGLQGVQSGQGQQGVQSVQSMQGRGRRSYADREKHLRRPGEPVSNLGEETVDIKVFMNKISEISGDVIEPLLLNDIETIFKNLCVSKDSLASALSNLHYKALCDPVFGEKFVMLVEHIANVEIENTTVRAEFLRLIQKDYLVKETMAQSDNVKFTNAMLLLSSAYRRLYVSGKPISVLGVALLDYLSLLLQGDEEQYKILAKEVFLNAASLASALASEPKQKAQWDFLNHSIRRSLVQKNLSSYSKCCLLLVIDFISNKFEPPTEVIRDFYFCSLGDDYLELESMSVKSGVPVAKPQEVTNSHTKHNTNNLAEHMNHLDVKEAPVPDPVADIKSDVDNIREKMRVQGLIPGKKHTDDRRNRKWQDGEKLSDDEKIWGMAERNGNMSGHDDRFVKDEDYYGIQLPRTPKPRKIQGRNEAGLRKSLDANWQPKSVSKTPDGNEARRGENSWD